MIDPADKNYSYDVMLYVILNKENTWENYKLLEEN